MSGRRTQVTWILVTFVTVLVIDQVTKALVTRYIPDFRPYQDGVFFQLTYQTNPGLVGGMFGDVPWVAMVAPVLATLVLAYLYRHLEPGSKLQGLAYGLIAGGALGNLVDRFFRTGGVVDFLQVHFYFIPFDFPWKQYPAFNMADSAICTGVFLLLFGWRRYEKPNVSDPS